MFLSFGLLWIMLRSVSLQNVGVSEVVPLCIVLLHLEGDEYLVLRGQGNIFLDCFLNVVFVTYLLYDLSEGDSRFEGDRRHY